MPSCSHVQLLFDVMIEKVVDGETKTKERDPITFVVHENWTCGHWTGFKCTEKFSTREKSERASIFPPEEKMQKSFLSY